MLQGRIVSVWAEILFEIYLFVQRVVGGSRIPTVARQVRGRIPINSVRVLFYAATCMVPDGVRSHFLTLPIVLTRYISP